MTLVVEGFNAAQLRHCDRMDWPTVLMASGRGTKKKLMEWWPANMVLEPTKSAFASGLRWIWVLFRGSFGCPMGKESPIKRS